MIRPNLGRTLLGAALMLALIPLTIAPASAATPVITWQSAITDGASYVFGKVPAAPTCTATDDLVAVPCVVTGYDVTVGTHVLTATAVSTDTATTTVEARTYTVTAWRLKGFYKPVKMNALNKVKAGSTVPLKFKVYQGTTKRKSTSVVSTFTAQKVDCSTLAPLGAAIPVAKDKKGFRLKYKDGAYHQNWKTPKLPKPVKVKGKKVVLPTCYQVVLTTDDGSTLTANFRLK